MSWLTKRVQAGRLRGKNRSKQAQARRRQLRTRVVGDSTARFLSGAIEDQKEREAPVQSKDTQGGWR